MHGQKNIKTCWSSFSRWTENSFASRSLLYLQVGFLRILLSIQIHHRDKILHFFIITLLSSFSAWSASTSSQSITIIVIIILAVSFFSIIMFYFYILIPSTLIFVLFFIFCISFSSSYAFYCYSSSPYLLLLRSLVLPNSYGPEPAQVSNVNVYQNTILLADCYQKSCLDIYSYLLA